MTQRARERALSQFENDPTKRIFLLSIRSSAVGINLTSASRVCLFEPFMNVALEKQSISRSWRLGQTRPVTVYRLYHANSLEQRILHQTTTNNTQQPNTWNVLNIRQLLEEESSIS
jgi:SNF2 family DNA or RNA helicase